MDQLSLLGDGVSRGWGGMKIPKKSRPWWPIKLIFLWKLKQKTFFLRKGRVSLALMGTTWFLQTAGNLTIQISPYQSFPQYDLIFWIQLGFLPLTSLWNSQHFAINAKLPVWQESYLGEWDGQSIHSRIWLFGPKFCSQSACNWEDWCSVSLEVLFKASLPY